MSEWVACSISELSLVTSRLGALGTAADAAVAAVLT